MDGVRSIAEQRSPWHTAGLEAVSLCAPNLRLQRQLKLLRNTTAQASWLTTTTNRHRQTHDNNSNPSIDANGAPARPLGRTQCNPLGMLWSPVSSARQTGPVSPAPSPAVPTGLWLQKLGGTETLCKAKQRGVPGAVFFLC